MSVIGIFWDSNDENNILVHIKVFCFYYFLLALHIYILNFPLFLFKNASPQSVLADIICEHQFPSYSTTSHFNLCLDFDQAILIHDYSLILTIPMQFWQYVWFTVQTFFLDYPVFSCIHPSIITNFLAFAEKMHPHSSSQVKCNRVLFY